MHNSNCLSTNCDVGYFFDLEELRCKSECESDKLEGTDKNCHSKKRQTGSLYLNVMMACVLIGLLLGIISETDCFKRKEKEISFEFPQQGDEEEI